MKKTLLRILAAYLIASALFSAAFAAAAPHQRGDMLRARCGLLCVDIGAGRVCSDGLYGLFNRI